MNKIMVIEDDDTIREGLKYYLESSNYEVIDISIGNDSLSKLNNVDLILLDINLPDINGYELFKKIKEIKNIPIIFLTANSEELSIVRGLDMGADDYITKPFKAKELISRINNVLRRLNKTNIINIRNIKIDIDNRKVLKDNKDVNLTSLEYKILLILVNNPNRVFTREEILDSIWDSNGVFVNDNTLTVYIKRIREKLDDLNDQKIISTVRGIGYKIGDINE